MCVQPEINFNNNKKKKKKEKKIIIIHTNNSQDLAKWQHIVELSGEGG